MDTIKAIIGIVLPNTKDMRLIGKYGIIKWTYALLIKLLLAGIVILFIFDFLGITIFIGKK
jgi:hypothetical protein